MKDSACVVLLRRAPDGKMKFTVSLATEGDRNYLIAENVAFYDKFSDCSEMCKLANEKSGLSDDDVYKIVRSTLRLNFKKIPAPWKPRKTGRARWASSWS